MERRPLTPWALRDRLQARVLQHKGVRLTWETTFVVLEALRAYTSHPRRQDIAAVICMRYHDRPRPCEQRCRHCHDAAGEILSLFRGVPDI